MHPRTLGEYQLVRELGRGAVGVVWLATDGLGREVALKVVDTVDAVDQLRFQREVEALAAVRHPGVVVVHASGRSPAGQAWVATELVPGRDLRRVVQERGPLPPAEAGRVVRALADALAAVHRAGLVHRDLKPENAILRPDGRPVLIDFGLARGGIDRLTRTGEVVGTPAWMSPEQARGQPADARSDVWALGATLGYLLVGRPPFKGPGLLATLARVSEGRSEWPAPLTADCPPGLEAVVRSAMSPDPARRYEDAGRLRDALDAVGRGERPGGHRAPLAVGLATLAALAAGLLAWSGVARPRPPEPPVPLPSVPEPGPPPAPAPLPPEPAGVEQWPDRLVLHEPRRDTTFGARFLGRWVLTTHPDLPAQLHPIPADRTAGAGRPISLGRGIVDGAEDPTGTTCALLRQGRAGEWTVEWRELDSAPHEGQVLATWSTSWEEAPRDLELRSHGDRALVALATVTSAGVGIVRRIELARDGTPARLLEGTVDTSIWEVELAEDGRVWAAAGSTDDRSGALCAFAPAGSELRLERLASMNARALAIDPALGVLVGDGNLAVMLRAPGAAENRWIADAVNTGGLRPGAKLRGVAFVRHRSETLLLAGTTSEGGDSQPGELIAWRGPGERAFQVEVRIRWHAMDVSRDGRCLVLSGRGGVELLSIDGLTGRR